MRPTAPASFIRAIASPVASFHPRRMPLFSRRSYQIELGAVLFFSFALGMVDGVLIGVIVNKAFDGIVPAGRLHYAVAVLAAAPEFTNLTSFFWAHVAHARHKVRTINLLQIGLALLVSVMALIPRTEPGLWLLGACVIGARVLFAGIVTLRVGVWRANYPRADRGRITGKLAITQSLTVAAAGLAVSLALDRTPEAFRVAFPIAAALGLIGALLYSRVRVRRHRILLNSERNLRDDHRPSLSPFALLRILQRDRNYALFMLFIFILGSGNLMVNAPLIITLDEQFGLKYAGSIVITQTIPLVSLTLCVPLWARFLDRAHVVRFRAWHSWVFVAAQVLIVLGAGLHFLPLIYVGIAGTGVGYAGGAIAWNLGHLDFAPEHLAGQYMAIHLMLNGLRGILAPLAGIYLLTRLGTIGAGQWVFAVSLALCLAGALGFVWLKHRMGTSAATRPPA